MIKFLQRLFAKKFVSPKTHPYIYAENDVVLVYNSTTAELQAYYKTFESEGLIQRYSDKVPLDNMPQVLSTIIDGLPLYIGITALATREVKVLILTDEPSFVHNAKQYTHILIFIEADHSLKVQRVKFV